MSTNTKEAMRHASDLMLGAIERLSQVRDLLMVADSNPELITEANRMLVDLGTFACRIKEE